MHDTKKNMQHIKSEYNTETILSVEMSLCDFLIKFKHWKKRIQKFAPSHALRPFCQVYTNVTQKQAMQEPGERNDLFGKAKIFTKCRTELAIQFFKAK